MRERGSEGRVIKPVTSFAIVIPDMEKKKCKSHLQSFGFEPVYENQILLTSSFIVRYDITVAIQDKQTLREQQQVDCNNIIKKWKKNRIV